MSVPMQQQLFTASLDIQPPRSVREIDFDQVGGRISLVVGFARGNRFECPACGTIDQLVHDSQSREWRHLNFCQYQAYIKADVPPTT